MRSIRNLELKKAPSVSETLDWARTLLLLGIQSVDARDGHRDPAHPAQVPVRHRQGGQGPERLDRGILPVVEAAHASACRPAARPACWRSLSGFVKELRTAGIPVSLTENLDAMEALRHIPLEDREAFKYALAATMVKNNAHWKAFETVFEVYFSLRGRQYHLTDDGEGDGAVDELITDLLGARRGRRRRHRRV